MHKTIHMDDVLIPDKQNRNDAYIRVEDTALDINKTCRICLNKQDESNVSSLYNVSEYFPTLSISSAIEECFGILLRKDVTLPSFICSRCMLHTFEAYHLRQTILNTEEILNTQTTNIELTSDCLKKEENQINDVSSQFFLLDGFKNCCVNSEENILSSIASDHNYSKEATELIENDHLHEPHIVLNHLNQDEPEVNHSEEESVKIEEPLIIENEKKYSTKLLTSNTEKWWLKNLGPPYECKICGRKYGTLYRPFYMHIRTHFMNRFPCKYCGKKFAYGRLMHHIRTHTNERPYSCEFCKARFSLPGNLKRHLLLHTGEKPYVCDICDRGFNQKAAMENHKETHNPQIVCEICGNIFATKSAYKSHKLTSHKGENNSNGANDDEFKCVQCNIGFSKSQSLHRHSRIHDDSENITCGICNAVFHVHFSYNVHMFLHDIQQSTSKTQSYDCKFCFDTFADKQKIELHLLDHIANPFQCKHCNKYFPSKIQLNRHLRQHSDDRPYNCQDCKKTFRSLTTLRQHTQIHTGRKPYLCQICFKSFTQHQQLSSHMLTHTGEKKYVCQYCGKAFALNGNLTVHIRRHTGDTPYHCDICGKGFHDSSSRKRHIEWKHKNRNVKTENNV